MRRFVLILGFIGAGIFAGAFFLSFARPMLVENLLRELLRVEVQHRVQESLDGLSDTGITRLAKAALHATDAEIEAARASSRERVNAEVAGVIAAMSDPDCDCRHRLSAYLAQAENSRASQLLGVRSRLSALIESAYASVSASLLREFRIFTGANAIAFGLLAIVALVRRRARLQLLLPALVIVGAVAITAGLYLFNQDWLHTIVFADYLGWGYAAWLAIVALLLADIAFNRARVGTQLVNALANVVGGAAGAIPC
jgi:hypothetical protein